MRTRNFEVEDQHFVEILGDQASDNDLIMEEEKQGYTSAIERKDFTKNTDSNQTYSSLPGYDPPRHYS